MKVYPNPTNGDITIESDDIVNIYDILGRLVKTLDPKIEKHCTLKISGIYFFRSGFKTVKVVVIK